MGEVRGWLSLARFVWAMLILMRTGLKLQWWVQTHRYPRLEPQMLLAMRAIDELFKRDIGEFGSPARKSFIATTIAVENQLVELRRQIRVQYGR